MNRIEFMSRLAELLQDISPLERQEAMQYYNDYFDDAGEEYEAQVIKELESPQKVAVKIKAGLTGVDEESSEYSETGYTDTRFEQKDTPANRGENRYSSKTQRSTGKTIAIIILICFGLPIAVPLAIGLLAAVFGLLVAAVALFFAGFIIAMALVIAGIVSIVAGFAELAVAAPIGLGFIGSGLICLAIGAAGGALFVKFTMFAVPKIFRSIVELCRKPFHRKAV